MTAAQVQFNEYATKQPTHDVKGITGWFIRRGIARNRGQANMVMIALSIVFLIVATMIAVIGNFDNQSQYDYAAQGYAVPPDLSVYDEEY